MDIEKKQVTAATIQGFVDANFDGSTISDGDVVFSYREIPNGNGNVKR